MRTFTAELQGRVSLLAGFIGIIWLVELVDLFVLRGALDAAGIRPRDPDALWGIVWAPFLHGGLPHLIANTVPLLVLGWLVLLRRRADFLVVTALVTVVGGLGVWLFGRPQTIHIGASGVVFGYLGYLFLRAWFERSFTAMLLALVAGVLYGSALWGVLPGQRGISWEGHLFGFVSGGVTARLMSTSSVPSRLSTGRPVGYHDG